MTEGQMSGWHHLLNGHEFEQTPGDSKRQGSLKFLSFSRIPMQLEKNDVVPSLHRMRPLPATASPGKSPVPS